MANAILNVGQTGGQVNISTAAAPATPAAGIVTLYAGNDKALHALNADGVDVALGAGTSSPITIEQTNSLVSTGVGATASQGLAVVIGATACTNQSRSVVIGNQSCSLLGTYGSNSCYGAVVIGDRVCSLANGNNSTFANVAVGSNITIGASPINPDIVYGNTIITCNNNKGGNVAVALDSCVCNNYNGVLVGHASKLTNSNFATVIGFAACADGGDTDGGQIAIGAYSKSTALSAIAIGRSTCSTANGAITLGYASCALKPGQIAIGNNIATPATSAQCSVYVGNCITPGGNCSSAAQLGQVMVGFKVSQNNVPENIQGSVLVGHDITNNNQAGVGADGDTMVGIKLTTACSRGNNTVLGRETCGGGSQNVVIGYNNGFTATDSLSHYYNTLIGQSVKLGSGSIGNVVIGSNTTLPNSVCNSVVIGQSALSCNHSNVVLGESSCSTGRYSVAIGYQAKNCSQVEGGNSGVAIGYQVCGSGFNPIAIGSNGTCSTGSGVAIGRGAQSGDNSISIGGVSIANCNLSIAMGFLALGSACCTISLGTCSCGSALDAVAIGTLASSTHACAVVLGKGLSSVGTSRTHMRQPNVQNMPSAYLCDACYYAAIAGATAGDFYILDSTAGKVLTVAGFN